MPPWRVLLFKERTTLEESFCPGIERLQGSPSVLGWIDTRGSHSVLGWKDSRGVLLSLEWNDSRGVFLSWDGTVLGESFHSRTEGPQGSHSRPEDGTNPGESSSAGEYAFCGVLLSFHGTTTGESFCPGIERLRGSHSVLG